MENLLGYLVSGLSVGIIYGLVALGFVLIYKASRILNFAVGELLMFGAYFCWTALTLWHFPVWASFLFALVASAALGWLIERIALRSLIGQPILGVIMMTIALSTILLGTATLVWGALAKMYDPPIFPSQALRWGGLVIRQEYIWGFIIAIILLVIFTLFFRKTMSGLAMRATSENHQLARGTGIRVKTVFSQSWMICAMVSGVAGIILASMTSVTLDLTQVGLKSVAVVLVGGLESIPGAIIAGLIIGIAEGLARGYIDPLVGGGIAEVFAFGIAIVSLLIWPYGLFGLRRIERI